MPRDLKIFPLFTESEILLEFIELLLDSIMDKDNSMLAFSTTAHGCSSLPTRSQPSKKSEVKKAAVILLPSLTQESTTLLKRMKLLLFKTSENGHFNTLLNTT